MPPHQEIKNITRPLWRVSDYYGLVMNIERFKKAINDLDKVRNHEVDLSNISDSIKRIS